jgi:hypothetical protein
VKTAWLVPELPINCLAATQSDNAEVDDRGYIEARAIAGMPPLQ